MFIREVSLEPRWWTLSIERGTSLKIKLSVVTLYETSLIGNHGEVFFYLKIKVVLPLNVYYIIKTYWKKWLASTVIVLSTEMNALNLHTTK